MNMRNPPYWMMNYIHTRVARRAAAVEYQMAWQLELKKSQQLVEIEDRDRTEKIKKVKQDGWIL
jgi:hypothetical protein